jgi:hypothetical protein
MDRTRTRLIAALIVGALAVPAVAFMATAGNDDGSQDAPAGQATVVVSTTAAAPTADAASFTDLQLACGAEAAALIAGEAAGTLTPVEQAALDALRLICDDAGFPLAGPPVAEPRVVVIETTADPAPATAAPEVPSGSYDDDDEYEGDHEYEGEHEHGEDD